MRFPAVPLAITLAATVANTLAAQGAMRVAPSGRATTEVSLTLVDSVARAAVKPSIIRIDYGQPHLRGRALGTDSLVPYDKPWRLGSNGATMLTTDVDLVLGNSTIPKGAWVLQALPSRSGWKLLVQRVDAAQTAMAAAMAYDPTKDFAKIDLRQTALAMPLESLSIWLIPSRDAGPPHGELRLAWGTMALTTTWSVK